MITQMDLLTKYIMDSTPKAVNVIDLKGNKIYEKDDKEVLDEEIWFLQTKWGFLTWILKIK